MLFRVVVPQPSPDLVEVRILEWHKSVGDAVKPGDLLVELETDKALVEVSAGQEGFLRSVLCSAGEWHKLGTPLAYVSSTADEAAGADEQVAAGDFHADFE